MAKAKLGSGKRFKALKKKVGSAALAAHIGRNTAKLNSKNLQPQVENVRKSSFYTLGHIFFQYYI